MIAELIEATRAARVAFFRLRQACLQVAPVTSPQCCRSTPVPRPDSCSATTGCRESYDCYNRYNRDNRHNRQIQNHRYLRNFPTTRRSFSLRFS
jgi:hypothetical protein